MNPEAETNSKSPFFSAEALKPALIIYMHQTQGGESKRGHTDKIHNGTTPWTQHI